MLDKNGFKSAGKNPKGIDLMQDKDQKRRNSTTNFYHGNFFTTSEDS